MLKVTLTRSYKKLDKNGMPTTVFVYAVKGTDAALEQYKTAMADYYRADEKGTPIWFSTKCIGNTGDLIITSAGKVVADMSKFDQAASLASQYGGNLGLEIAKQMAQQLRGNSHSVGQSAPAAQTAVVAQPIVSESTMETSEVEQPEELGDL